MRPWCLLFLFSVEISNTVMGISVVIGVLRLTTDPVLGRTFVVHLLACYCCVHITDVDEHVVIAVLGAYLLTLVCSGSTI